MKSIQNNNEISLWEFLKYSLQRNDEAIRFSEAKAALLLTIIGLLMGGFIANLDKYKSLLISESKLVTTVSIFSLVLVLGGFLLSIVPSILIIFPRTHVVKNISLLFFDNYDCLSEEELRHVTSNLSTQNKIEQLTAQVHATSKIAHIKFESFKISLIGILILLSGYFISILLYIII